MNQVQQNPAYGFLGSPKIPIASLPTLREVYEKYSSIRYRELEDSTIQCKEDRIHRFLGPIFEMNLTDVTDIFLDNYIVYRKAHVINPRKCSFKNDLVELKSMLNWYFEEYNLSIPLPLKKRHFTLGKIKTVPTDKCGKMNEDEVALFFKTLEEESPKVFHDLAISQFYLSARIQEAAGLTKDKADFKKKTILIKDVAVWDYVTKEFKRLKPIPKNSEIRFCNMVESLEEIIKRRIHESKSKFLFELEGQPLSYRKIQHHYDKALKKCGLFDRFSGTHIMRHAAASICRSETNSVEHVQAMTGHKDVRMAQHYSGGPSLNINTEATRAIEKRLKESMSQLGGVVI